MENKDKDEYLPEDQTLLNELESIDFNDATGAALEKRKGIVSKLQIKAILKSRKQAADNDKSNKQFTVVLGAFALVQILIAGFQFTLDAAISTNQALAIFLAVTFVITVFWFVKEVDKILKDK